MAFRWGCVREPVTRKKFCVCASTCPLLPRGSRGSSRYELPNGSRRPVRRRLVDRRLMAIPEIQKRMPD